MVSMARLLSAESSLLAPEDDDLNARVAAAVRDEIAKAHAEGVPSRRSDPMERAVDFQLELNPRVDARLRKEGIDPTDPKVDVIVMDICVDSSYEVYEALHATEQRVAVARRHLKCGVRTRRGRAPRNRGNHRQRGSRRATGQDPGSDEPHEPHLAARRAAS